MPARNSRPALSWIEPAAVVAFGAACLILGGSSRADAPTLLFLRPLVVLCLMIFALRIDRERLRVVAVPLMLLGAFAATIAVQLVPIPTGIWALLQGRAPYATALAGLGLDASTHPLSLTPDRTWNSLIALLVPLTMLLAYTASGRAVRTAMLPALLIGGMASAVLGIGQLAGGQESLLYFYRATNSEYPVGVFANRNHEAAFLAIMLPALRAWALSRPSDIRSARTPLPRSSLALAIGIFLVPMILATGSRAGFVLMFLGLGAAWAIAPVRLPRPRTQAQRWAIPVALLGIALLVVVTITSGRAVALQRLISSPDPTSDLRVTYLPVILGLIRRFWLFGSGFGSFDPVLRGAEPDALLHDRYFNNAHDDLLELVLTGGLPSLIVLIAFLLWWGRAGFAAFRAPAPGAGVYTARAATAMIGLSLLASLLDYPLRTPLMGAVMALSCAWLARRPETPPGLPVARDRPHL